MKYLSIVSIALFTWFPARADTYFEKAYADLKVAVNEAKKETANRQNAYNAAIKRAADLKKEANAAKAAADKRVAAVVRQAEVMKAAIAKIADIEKKVLGAHEALKKMTPSPPKSDLSRALAVLTEAVDDTRKASAALKTSYNASVKRADVLKEIAENDKVLADKKAADAANRAKSLKASVFKAIDIQNKTQAALESVKLVIEAQGLTVGNSVTCVIPLGPSQRNFRGKI